MRKPNAICEGCASPFYARPSAKLEGGGRFCKHSCFILKKYGTKSANKICPTCNKEFEIKKKKDQKYCSQSCATKSTNRNRRGMKYDSAENFKTRLVKRYGHKCAICGYEITLDGHHILPKAKNGSDDLTNGILLCPNHHREVHLGLITTEDLLNYKSGADSMIGASNVQE